MLKKQLQQMKESDKPLVFSDQLLQAMLGEIGSIDPELRDNLIYDLFGQGVATQAISNRQQKALVNEILSNRLVLKEITKTESDAVFTRSFAVLLLALLVSADQQQPGLTITEFNSLQELACRYVREEADTRGFIIGKGWAHGLAHVGDLLSAIVSHPSFNPATTDQILISLASPIFRHTEKFGDLEEDRLSQVVSVLLVVHPDQVETVSNWLQKLAERLAETPGRESWEADYYHFYQKYYQFIQALYFQLLTHDQRALAELGEQLRQLIAHKYA